MPAIRRICENKQICRRIVQPAYMNCNELTASPVYAGLERKTTRGGREFCFDIMPNSCGRESRFKVYRLK